MPYLRDKDVKRELRNGELPFGVAFTREVWNQIDLRQRHQNRSKRSRFHRIELHIEQLKKLDKRQNLINRLNREIDPDSIPASEILNAEAISEKWFDSHCFGKLPRLDYLIDLLENYCPYFDEICRTGDHNIVVCHAADTTPLTEDEKSRLHSFLSTHFPPQSAWQLHFATDNSIPDEMALQFIGIESPAKHAVQH